MTYNENEDKKLVRILLVKSPVVEIFKRETWEEEGRLTDDTLKEVIREFKEGYDWRAFTKALQNKPSLGVICWPLCLAIVAKRREATAILIKQNHPLSPDYVSTTWIDRIAEQFGFDFFSLSDLHDQVELLQIYPRRYELLWNVTATQLSASDFMVRLADSYYRDKDAVCKMMFILHGRFCFASSPLLQKDFMKRVRGGCFFVLEYAVSHGIIRFNSQNVFDAFSGWYGRTYILDSKRVIIRRVVQEKSFVDALIDDEALIE
jgi:hypothetical protein